MTTRSARPRSLSLGIGGVCLTLLIVLAGCGGNDTPPSPTAIAATAPASTPTLALASPTAPAATPTLPPAPTLPPPSPTPPPASPTTDPFAPGQIGLPSALPTAPPSLAPPSATPEPPTIAPPSATPEPPSATRQPPTATRVPPTRRPATPTVAPQNPPPPPRTPQPAPTNTPRPAAPPTTAPPLAATPSADEGTPTPRPVEVGVPDPGTKLPDGRTEWNGQVYDVYIPAALKTDQEYHYTCEFDAAWVVLKTYGYDATLNQMLKIVGVDKSVEPRWEDTPKGAYIYGGNILTSYSGDYVTNFLARTTGPAMRKLFTHYGLATTPVHTQAGIEAALRAGSLVWIKTTADFKPGRAAIWVLPDGSTYHTVLGNDHAAVVMGYNATGALIRDVLGPTSTNMQRDYQYEVPWARFLSIWASQSNDGLAVAPPGHR